MRDCITNSNSAPCQYALLRHLAPLRSVLGQRRWLWTALAGATKEIAAGHGAAAA
jgi:hypothetical protein